MKTTYKVITAILFILLIATAKSNAQSNNTTVTYKIVGNEIVRSNPPAKRVNRSKPAAKTNLVHKIKGVSLRCIRAQGVLISFIESARKPAKSIKCT